MSWFDDLRSRFGRADDPELPPPTLPPADEVESPVDAPAADTAPAGVAVMPSAANTRSDAPRADGASSTIFYRYYTDIHGTPDHSRAYEHGHVDGTHEGDPDAFRAVIEHAERTAHLNARLATEREVLEAVRADRNTFKTLHVRLAGAAQRLGHLTHARDVAVRDHIEAAAFYDEAVAVERDTRDRSSWLNVWVYGLATIAFLVGDMMVSKVVVSQVLQLPDTPFMGLSEQWWFAIGIALLAMVVKLGYERLVEAPYQKGHRRSFRWVVNLSIAFTLFTLGVLGWTRSHYRTEMDAGAVSIADALRGTAQAMPVAHETPTLIVWAFVMTAVLFAVTGGLCGGVTAQAWHVQMDERRPARKRLAETKRRLAEARREWDTAERVLAEAQEAQATDERAASHLPALDVLDARTAEAEAVVAATADELRASRTAWLTALYDSGFTLAEANRVYLDKTPHATMRRLAQLSADVLRAMQDGQIAETEGQSLIYALQHAAEQYLAGDLTLDGFRALLGVLEQRLAELVAAGPSSAGEAWPGEGDGSPRAPSSRSYAGPRPFVWARQEMARLSRQ